MTPSGQPLGERKLRSVLTRSQRILRENRQLDDIQRACLVTVVQTMTWALHELDCGTPALDPVQAAMLGPHPAGRVRLDLEATMGPKRWQRFSIGKADK